MPPATARSAPQKPVELLSLPSIARRPVPHNSGIKLAADHKAQSARAPSSPYLSRGDTLNESLLSLPLPPMRSAEPSPNRKPQPPPAQQASPAQSASPPTEEAGSKSHSSNGDLNELTVTYLKVLQRSEDYNRRAIMRDRDKSMANAETPWRRLNGHILKLLADFAAVRQRETAQRKAMQDEEVKNFHVIDKLAEVSHATAKRHEDVRPTCPLIAANGSVLLDPSCSASLIVEMRWRGGSAVQMQVLIYDDADKLVACGNKSEVVRGLEGTVAIRHIASLNGAATIGTGGSRSSFHMCLGNLPPRTAKVIFCAFGERNADLADLSRTWFTLYEPGNSPAHVVRELYACASLEGGSLTGVIVAALTRRVGDVWNFVCLNEAVLGGVPSQRVAPFAAHAIKEKAVFNEMHFLASRERVVGSYMVFIEDWSRKAIVQYEAILRNELHTLQKVEAALAMKKQQQNRYVRAFRRPSSHRASQ